MQIAQVRLAGRAEKTGVKPLEQKRNLVLTGTETFSKGGLDNVALESGCIVLDGVAGRHMPYGCYTTPEFAMPAFCNLNVSWNADTPEETVIETQCRVLAGGRWTGWMTFGKWSPDYPRKSHSTAGAQDEMVFCIGDTVTVAVPGGGSAVQLRIHLYSDDEKQTPAVRLLAAAVRPLQWEKQAGRPVNRTLFLPAYNLALHDPSFGARMDLPLTLAALMNRYGEDVLPEELAYGMSDGATASCHNAAYAAAIAGSCGYGCWQVWADLKQLRGEIRTGYAAAVELEQKSGAREGGTRWMGLHGFCHDEALTSDIALLLDPSAPQGEEALRLPAEEFRQLFTGRALLLRPRQHGVGGVRPNRMCCSLKPGNEPGEYLFEKRGELWPLPERFAGWIAAALRDGVAHATTAARTFVRLEATASGGVRLPSALNTPGARYSLYAVDETGSMRVAELRVPGTPAAAAKAAPENADQQ